MSGPLTDRVALVTGGGRGIGRAIALGLAQRGARVLVLARSGSEVESVAAEIRATGQTAVAVTADTGRPEEAVAAVRRATERLGDVDVLVNNAAVVWPLGPTPRLDPTEIAAALQVNVVGVVALSRALAPPMIAAGWGRIVNISSGIVGQPQMMIGGTIYAAGKAALEAHTINLAAELAGTGVTVNAYRPGAVDTAMQEWIRGQSPDEIGAELHDRFVATHAGGELLTPERSAESLLARLDDGTGQILDVADTMAATS